MPEAINILSIDVEELFHAEYAKTTMERHLDYRTPDNLQLVLRLLKEHCVNATFFIVGEIVEKFPEIISMITNDGHEVAFHSYDHKPLWEKKPEHLQTEVMKFNGLLRSITGDRCMGFRAPSFSLDNKTIWALEVLEEAEMLYDSSVFPMRTPFYGVPDAPTTPYKPSKDDLTVEDDSGRLWEFPLTVYPLLGFRIPAAGGFYMRFMPCLVERAIKKINKLGSPAVIYLHNWELDPNTPKLRLNLYKSFVTYHNIGKATELFKRLLRRFRFTTFTKYMRITGTS